jgi:hypothetical protein
MQENQLPDDAGESSSQAVFKSGSLLPQSRASCGRKKLCSDSRHPGGRVIINWIPESANVTANAL